MKGRVKVDHLVVVFVQGVWWRCRGMGNCQERIKSVMKIMESISEKVC